MAFPRYVIAGAINTGLTYLLYLMLLQFMSYPWAYSVTYAAGIVLGYTLNALWVFRTRPDLRTATLYPFAYFLNYLMGIALVFAFVELARIPAAVAPLLALAISVPAMYFLNRALFDRRRMS